MSRSPLTDTFQKVQGMVSHVQQNLSGDEYNLFLDMVAPQPEPEPTAKKTRKKRATKSPKAQSLESVIKSSHEAKVEAPKSNGLRCIAKIPGLDVECGDPEDNRVHDKSAGYAGYHPFQASASIQPAEKKSRRKEAHTLSVPNSEIEKVAAITAGS